MGSWQLPVLLFCLCFSPILLIIFAQTVGLILDTITGDGPPRRERKSQRTKSSTAAAARAATERS